MTIMLWLIDLVLRLAWTSTEGVLRFPAAMVVVALNLVGIWRFVQWMARQTGSAAKSRFEPLRRAGGVPAGNGLQLVPRDEPLDVNFR